MRRLVAFALWLAAATPAYGQTRAWIDLDVAAIVPEQSFQTFTTATRVPEGDFLAAINYPDFSAKAAPGMFVAGGIDVLRRVGVAGRWDRSSLSYTTVFGGSIARVPGAVAAGSAGQMHRVDHSVDISAVFLMSPQGTAWRVRLFAGPTYFRVSQEMVSAFQYAVAANPGTGVPRLTVTTHDEVAVAGSAWGGHVGGDVAYFFTKRLGAGGTIELSRGSANVIEPFTGERTHLTVGHVAVGGGLRLRF